MPKNHLRQLAACQSMLISTQVGPLSKIDPRHCNHLQNRLFAGVPIGADRDPASNEIPFATSNGYRAPAGGSASALFPSPASDARAVPCWEGSMSQLGSGLERFVDRRLRSQSGRLKGDPPCLLMTPLVDGQPGESSASAVIVGNQDSVRSSRVERTWCLGSQPPLLTRTCHLSATHPLHGAKISARARWFLVMRTSTRQ